MTSIKFIQDNPGGEWLKYKQEDAEHMMSKYGNSDTHLGKGFNGSITGYFNKPLNLPVEHLKDIPGATGEEKFRNTDEHINRFNNDIKGSENFNSEKHPIFIAVNHKGSAYVMEGNHRLAYAHKHGIQNIHAEVRYFNGGEESNSKMNPETLQNLHKEINESVFIRKAKELLGINEELTPEQKKEVDGWARADYSFSDHAFPNKADRVTIPLKDHSSIPIKTHLDSNGFKNHNFDSGFTEDKHGRQIAIGKALTKSKAPQHLINLYSKKRKSVGNEFAVTISRHPHDVAGMTSEGQPWEDSSCMNFESGCNNHYLPSDVASGTHVAYLHRASEDHNTPLARIAIKPFISEDNKHKILVPEGKTYGESSDDFAHTVNDWTNTHFKPKDTVYSKHSSLYHDSGSRVKLGDSLSNETFERLINSNRVDVRTTAAAHPKLNDAHFDHIFKNFGHYAREHEAAASNTGMSSDYIHGIIKNDGNKYSIMTRTNVLKNNPNVTAEHIKAAVNDPENNISKLALQHPKLPKEIMDSVVAGDDVNKKHFLTSNPGLENKHIDALINSKDLNAYSYSLSKNKNLNHQHVSKMLDHIKDDIGDNDTMLSLIRHNSTNSKQLEAISKMPIVANNSQLQRALVYHDKSNKDITLNVMKGGTNATTSTNLLYDPKLHDHRHIELALNDHIKRMPAENAAKSPHITSEQIHKAISYPDEFVGISAIQNPNATEEHLLHALDHNVDESIGKEALKHKNVTENVINKALEHPSRSVKIAAIGHSLVSADHITKALNDSETDVRRAALKNPNLTNEQISKALDDPEPTIRKVAIRHPKVTSDQITKMLNDKEWSVRNEALLSPNVTPEHINKALDDEDHVIRLNAIEHDHVNADHITKAMNDPDHRVRVFAIHNLKANSGHIAKALDDPETSVRMYAVKNPNANRENLTKALNDPSEEIRNKAKRLLDIRFNGQ